MVFEEFLFSVLQYSAGFPKVLYIGSFRETFSGYPDNRINPPELSMDGKSFNTSAAGTLKNIDTLYSI